MIEPAQYFILNPALERPDIYLKEIKSELQWQLGVSVCESTICTFLEKSKKKLKLYAIQRDEFIRAQFTVDVSLYTRDMLVFIDETGTDHRDSLRKAGYSLRGKPARAQKLLARGEHISVISAMSVDGILCCKI